MHHPTDRITHTTAFVTPVMEHWLEREIAQWVHPMKDRSDDPSHHERTLLPQSYILLLLFSDKLCILLQLNHIGHKHSVKDHSDNERGNQLLNLYGLFSSVNFSFKPVLHDWCNKGCGMSYPVCGMMHINELLLLIDKSSLCGDSGFPFSLSEWSLTIRLMPYNCK